jgi:hypothetical protein
MTPHWLKIPVKRSKNGEPDERYAELKRVHKELRKKYLKIKQANLKLIKKLEKAREKANNKKSSDEVKEYDEDLEHIKFCLLKGDLL